MKNTILFLSIIYLLTSCKTTEQKASRYYDDHKDKLAAKCANEFPVKDSTVITDSVRFDTLFIEGEPVLLRDSFYIKGDTVIKQVTKECPKVQTVVKTQVKQVDHYIENTARIKVFENAIEAGNKKIAEQQAEIKSLHDKVKAKNKWIWKLIIVVLIETLILFRKPILSLINPIKFIPPIS